MELKIRNLADCPKYVGVISKWLWNYWGREEGLSIKDVEYRIRHSMFRTRIPMTFVGIAGKRPVAVASFWHNALINRQDLTPWLAELFVVRDMRRKGIGTKMQNFVIEKARGLKLKSIYLMTYHKSYYERNGWRFLELAPFHHGKVKRVYEYRLDKKGVSGK